MSFLKFTKYSFHLLFYILSCLCPLCNAAQDINKFIQDTCPPCVYLLDTGVPFADKIPPKSLIEKKEWSLIPEGITDYAFQGDAVILNDKIAVVLRKHSNEADVYSLTNDGAVQRANLLPSGVENEIPISLSSIKIVENELSAVRLDAAYQTKNDTMQIGIRITTGSVMMEVYSGVGTKAIQLQTKSQYAVIPDFFADDMIFFRGILSRRHYRIAN